ncbi:MAG: glycosyltransferase [Ruminococcus sp.]|nr:glycosyltransferase [Ruminococcus sp.]
MKEKISIIIPVYNCKAWIKRCLDSVIKQTYQNLEILVIDDGSDDGSAEIIDSFVQKDNRIRFFSQTNQGVASARNQGLLHATGSIITFVDADDYIEKEMYEKMLVTMVEQETDIVECSCRRVNPGGRVLQNIELREEIVVGKKQCAKQYLRQANVTNYVCNKIYRRKLFASLTFPNLKYSEDYYVNARVHARAEKKVILPDIFYNYALYEGQATNASHVSLSNFDGVKSGRLVAEYFRKDKELCTYAAVYSCEYAIHTAKQYLYRFPEQWETIRKYIRDDFLYCCFHMWLVKNIDIDVLAKRRRYMCFFFKGEISRGILVQAIPELAQKEKQQEKCSRLLKLTCRWIMNEQKGIKAADFLIKRGWRSIAVYGAGDVGKCLLAELSGTDIEIRYMIDRRRIELNLPVYLPENDLPAVDCVIVTAVMDYEEVCRTLKDKLNCSIISIEDIIYQNDANK